MNEKVMTGVGKTLEKALKKDVDDCGREQK